MIHAIHTLSASSEIYYERASIYEELSAAEDADGLALSRLIQLVQGKTVLDVGCGSGKYVELLAPIASRIDGVDAAPAQLAIAQGKVDRMGDKGRHVRLVLGDALDAPLPHKSYDAAIACWMLGTVPDVARRLDILARVDSLLAPGGQIILVENDSDGAFERMRGRRDSSRAYNHWLLDTAGFFVDVQLSAKFRFPSPADAERVMGAIWGPAVGAQATSAEIEHRILVLRRPKQGQVRPPKTP